MSGSSFQFEVPSPSLFKFPPDSAPPALAPPPPSGTLRAPFGISADIYNRALDPSVPITIALVYAVTVTIVNAYNRSRGNKPWKISKTKPFFAFVIAHNVFLAVYSAVTCIAMTRALHRTVPGLNGSLVDNVDALCKMNGPRGLGDAATFNVTSGAWEVKNRLINLGLDGTPDPTDVGRLWNEGLAFWGWWFYLSKFYEVLDTFIILAKGKRSSTLQTYHHAGAMLCMWAGIRFMSPPIWMFVEINSGIHAMMYTYYTIAALGIRVPQRVKRTLTTMQIMQFLVGATFAAAHLCISYTVPVSTPYTLYHTVTSVVSAVASAASSEVASAVATAGMGAHVKKFLFRAAGQEALAENVRDDAGHVFGQEAQHITETISETRWRDEYQRVPCIDTTGQSFAIWLNVIYLMPLTALFVRFFVRSYITRTAGTNRSRAQTPHRHTAASKAAIDASKGVDREVESLGKAMEDQLAKLAHLIENKADRENFSAAHSEAHKQLRQTSGKAFEMGKRKLTELSAKYDKASKSVVDDAAEKARVAKETQEALQRRIEDALRERDAKGEGKMEESNGSITVEEGSTTAENAEDASYSDILKRPNA
ncbi:hypothetical protein K490DRAFT_76184 [Saccharata proteae CBS 121410]|uniref:Elongation of fatty acids protein n=1 Tax=Saccharata proteae CBS 121410 TaxID=1314787 RepID=A0A9P4HLS4_9PEZI|nr:hypothetical protein K490DRAFT_76184 [Saccharata proteae CBS 121410]